MSENESGKEEQIVICPNCKDFLVIEKLNCGIFRHGVFQENGKQINPHSGKDICDYYVRENKIYGCGKPFRIISVDNKFIPEICDYI